jgi:glycine dehydrogenase subunit 1
MYFFHTDEDRRQMLEAIGAESIEQILREQVPPAARMERPLQLGPALTEIELERLMRSKAGENVSPASHVCFMGAGAYDHFIPAAVDAIASRGEYYTSYTPYQAEVSQGNLQVMFEYETLITQLTGLDVSNASLYDGGSGAVEAVLMALAVSKDRRKVVTSATVHPEYREILSTYLAGIDAEVVTAAANGAGTTEGICSLLDEQTACVLIQHPNFFGRLEDVATIAVAAKQVGALVIHVFDPVSVGLLKRPGDLGADIAVAEGQGLGNPLAFGGPYLGIMACRQELVRRLPGRIAGQTVDRRGKRCWVLTLQTREQHIRRDKATSNICSNQTLLALRATIHLALLGPHGLRETAEQCVQKTAYAKARFAGSERMQVVHEGATFKEFVVRDRAGKVDELLNRGLRAGYLVGVPLGRWYPDISDCLLIAVTEQRTRAEIDALVDLLSLPSGSTLGSVKGLVVSESEVVVHA